MEDLGFQPKDKFLARWAEVWDSHANVSSYTRQKAVNGLLHKMLDESETLNHNLLKMLQEALTLLNQSTYADCRCDYHKGICGFHADVETLIYKYNQAKEGLA